MITRMIVIQTIKKMSLFEKISSFGLKICSSKDIASSCDGITGGDCMAGDDWMAAISRDSVECCKKGAVVERRRIGGGVDFLLVIRIVLSDMFEEMRFLSIK